MLVHADTFNRYGTDPSLLLNGLWAENYGLFGGVDLQPNPDGVTSGMVARTTAGNFGGLRLALPRLNATSGCALRMWVSNLSVTSDANSPIPFMWYDDVGNVVLQVRFTSSGRAQLLGTGGVLLGTSAIPVITANAWWHLEAKAFFSLSGAGTFELRLEGVPVFSLTGLTMAVQYPYSIAFGRINGGTTDSITSYFKDWVCWDGTGTYNNDFLGSVIVYDLIPNGDVTMGGWTSTDANGYSVLSNNPPNAAHYLSAAYPPPAASEFNFTDLPSNITSVKGLITRVRAAKVDGGDGSLQVSVKHAGSSQGGANRPITVAQTYFQDVFEVDPSTSAPWVPLGVAAMTATLNRTV